MRCWQSIQLFSAVVLNEWNIRVYAYLSLGNHLVQFSPEFFLHRRKQWGTDMLVFYGSHVSRMIVIRRIISTKRRSLRRINWTIRIWRNVCWIRVPIRWVVRLLWINRILARWNSRRIVAGWNSKSSLLKHQQNYNREGLIQNGHCYVFVCDHTTRSFSGGLSTMQCSAPETSIIVRKTEPRRADCAFPGVLPRSAR